MTQHPHPQVSTQEKSVPCPSKDMDKNVQSILFVIATETSQIPNDGRKREKMCIRMLMAAFLIISPN